MNADLDIYDILVVGGGHAGCEAALCSARLGLKTLLVTGSIDRIAAMSCNPAIGGVGKGHLVKEIDALGGQMAKVADDTGIHLELSMRREAQPFKQLAVKAIWNAIAKKCSKWWSRQKTSFCAKTTSFRSPQIQVNTSQAFSLSTAVKSRLDA